MNNQDLNTAIYNEVAKAAAEAFEFLRIAPGKYTPAQIVAAMKKKAASWNDDPADRLQNIINISIDSFSCSFPLCGSFDLLARMATAYEVPTKARVTFERAAEELPTLLTLDVPAAAREVAKAVSKKDPLRPSLTFAYFDKERRALVGTNGQILTVCAAPSAELTPGADDRKGFFISPALLRSKRIKVDQCNATDGQKVFEAPNLSFPRWYTVFPELHDTDAVELDKTTAAALRKAVATATKYAEPESGPNGFNKYIAIFGEAYTEKLIIRARRCAADTWQYREICVPLPAALSRSFALVVDGEAFTTLPAFNTLYVPANRRPAVVTGAGVVSLVFALSLPEGFATVCDTDAAPAWAKIVDPLTDLLPTAEPEAPAEVIATPAEVVATPEPEPEPEAQPEPEPLSETTAEVVATPAPVVVVDRDELPTPDGLTISTPRPRAEILKPQPRPWITRKTARRALRFAALLLAALLLAISPDRIENTTAAPTTEQNAPTVPSVRKCWHMDLMEPDTPAEEISEEPAEAVELREVVVLPQHNKKRAHSATKSTTAAPAEVVATPEPEPEPEAQTEPEPLSETTATTEPETLSETPAEVVATPTENDGQNTPENVPEPEPETQPETPATGPTAPATTAASFAPVLVAAGVPAVAIPYIIACF